MSLDACFLSLLTNQINTELCSARVDKINMPSRDEIVFSMRSASKAKLLISASTNSPRMCITDAEFENPATPPTFCMVLRKHFLSSKLKRVYMPEFERYVVLEFECKNDFFEPCTKNIIVELMGRSSNMILTEDGKIIDAIRRVDLSSDSGRCILPSAKYYPPKTQSGKTPFDALQDVAPIFSNPELTLEKALMEKVSGISPILARELAYRSALGSDKRIKQLGRSDMERLLENVSVFQSMISTGNCSPCVVTRRDTGKAVDFCFFEPTQYGDFCEIKKYAGPSSAVDGFFAGSAAKARFEQKTRDLSKFLTRTIARITRTMQVRSKELHDSENADKYRLYGELINANLYRMQKGEGRLVCENYYDECREITIPLKRELSPSANAAAYFKKYTKAKNSCAVLRELIQKDKAELEYLESVFYALCECEAVSDAEQIRLELENGGYLHRRARIKKSEKPSMPKKYEKDGFTILVGRNNIQNDYVTVKLSRKNDIWLHTKNIHSSHVIICCGGLTPPPQVIEYAARLCAYYSRAKDDLKVEVDYCPVQNVKKPSGAKPGMVVYDVYETVVVNPMTQNQLKSDG